MKEQREGGDAEGALAAGNSPGPEEAVCVTPTFMGAAGFLLGGFGLPAGSPRRLPSYAAWSLRLQRRGAGGKHRASPQPPGRPERAALPAATAPGARMLGARAAGPPVSILGLLPSGPRSVQQARVRQRQQKGPGEPASQRRRFRPPSPQ